MIITSVEVEDPRSKGLYEDPILRITVDEPVYEQALPLQVSSQPRYRYIPCGPFVAVEYEVSPGAWEEVSPYKPPSKYGDLGVFNASGALAVQLVPVLVLEPDDEVSDLCMSVYRARRLLRKHDINDWQIIVDEQAALNGLLKWRLELSDPVCYGGAVPGRSRCLAEPKHTIVYRGTHLTLCDRCNQRQQSIMRSQRIGD